MFVQDAHTGRAAGSQGWLHAQTGSAIVRRIQTPQSAAHGMGLLSPISPQIDWVSVSAAPDGSTWCRWPGWDTPARVPAGPTSGSTVLLRARHTPMSAAQNLPDNYLPCAVARGSVRSEMGNTLAAAHATGCLAQPGPTMSDIKWGFLVGRFGFHFLSLSKAGSSVGTAPGRDALAASRPGRRSHCAMRSTGRPC